MGIAIANRKNRCDFGALSPRVCKPWFPNRGSRFVTKQVKLRFKKLRPPPTWQRSQNPPRLKKSKKSLRKSLWGSLRGSWPSPENESKTSLLETLRVKNHLFFDSGDLFLTRFGGSARSLGDSPRDSPGDSFLTFRDAEGFDSSARSGGSQ